MNPVKVVATMHADPEIHDAIKADMLKIVPKTRAETGCLQYEFYAVDQTEFPGLENTGGDFVVLEAWQDMNALQVHAGADHIQAFINEYSDKPLKITVQVLK